MVSIARDPRKQSFQDKLPPLSGAPTLMQQRRAPGQAVPSNSLKLTEPQDIHDAVAPVSMGGTVSSSSIADPNDHDGSTAAIDLNGITAVDKTISNDNDVIATADNSDLALDEPQPLAVSFNDLPTATDAGPTPDAEDVTREDQSGPPSQVTQSPHDKHTEISEFEKALAIHIETWGTSRKQYDCFLEVLALLHDENGRQFADVTNLPKTPDMLRDRFRNLPNHDHATCDEETADLSKPRPVRR